MARFVFILLVCCCVVVPLAAQVPVDSGPPSVLRSSRTPLPGLVAPPLLQAWWFTRAAPPRLTSLLGGPTTPFADTTNAARLRLGTRSTGVLLPMSFPFSEAAATDRLLHRLGYERDDRGGMTEMRTPLGLSPRTADISLDGELRVALSTSRQRALNCTPVMLASPYSGCRGTFSAPRIENLLVLRSRGVFGQRLHADIDMDTGRSYEGNNIFRLYFQGLEDEVIQRVDAGSVQFRAPTSRFLGASVPVNNQGLSADLQLGPVAIQAIMARQEGDQTAERIFAIGEQTTQAQDRRAGDQDFERDRFFWVVDPATLPGWPAIDILSLDQVAVPDLQRPVEVQVYRYVAANQPGTVGATYDGIMATGWNGEERAGPLRWQLLQPGVDYWLDPSGLWFALAGAIDFNDFLAVSYRTQAGTMVGTMPMVDRPEGADSVRLIAMPNRGPASPLFLHGMRQVYRVGGELVRSSLRVALEVGRSEQPATGAGTYLSLLGLATPGDEALFDLDNRLFPRTRDPGANQVIRDQLIVFPHAQPFADAVRLSPAERNDSLYRTPEYLLASQGPPTRFQLLLRYDALSSGDRSGFFLGEIREGTERITVNGRPLERGVDYRISYESGQVTFLKPNELFPSTTGSAIVSVSYVRQSFFAVAPTSLQGLSATWVLGRLGSVSLVSLYQREQSAYRRPPVGSEPKAGFLGGITSTFNLDLPGVTAWFSGLSRRSLGAPSTLALTGEVALSRPDPNRYGEAFLEEFENDGGIPILLTETNWLPGSQPQQPTGLELLGFSGGFQLPHATQLTWQNLIQYGNGFFEVTSQDIDSTIRVADTRTLNLETVLWTALHADTAGGMVDSLRRSHWTLPHTPAQPRWRSITTPLSNTGVDLTQNEYLEFWLYQTRDSLIQKTGMRIVVDLGKVSEDAVSLAPTDFTVSGNDTTWSGRQYPGLGVLNTERTPLGTWNALTDDKGILGDRPDSVVGPGGVVLPLPALCQARQVDGLVAFPWADLSSRCTNGNGVLDTEDLDGDGVLNALGSNEDVHRYIVDIRDPKYFVRDRNVVLDESGRSATWTLYRIPLRDPDAVLGQADLRLARQMRLTFVTPPGTGGIDPTIFFGLARMRLTGAPWVRRSDRPILGLSGAIAEAHGSVLVGSISTQNVELGYTSPPGLGNTPNEHNPVIGVMPTQVNEKSLRIIARDLQGGERAEAYHRLGSGQQNLLAYEQLRVWLRGSGPGWASGDLEAYLKVGSDAYNFYLYRAPASTVSWEPDHVIEMERWRALRADIEERFQRGEAPSGAAECGGDPEAWIACDGRYMVQIRDPQINPPNLAAVQELATGIWRQNGGTPIPETELWVDDIRVREPVSETGVAAAMSGRLIASDVGTLDVDWSRRDGRFRQLGEVPSYRTVTTARVGGSFRLDRLIPTMGFEIPISYSLLAVGTDPQLVGGSDIRGSSLVDLRRPATATHTWSVSVRRTAGYSKTELSRFLLDPLTISLSGGDASNTTELSNSSVHNFSANLNYQRSVPRRGRPLGLGGVVRALPDWLERGVMGQSLARSSVALSPHSLRFGSSLTRSAGDYLSFKSPMERLSDTILRPVTSLQHLWSNNLGATWQPIGLLSLSADWRSTRDLRQYPDSTSLGRLVGMSREALLGQDIGVERDRTVTSTAVVSPVLATWLRPTITSTSNFYLSRSLTSRAPVRLIDDSLGGYILPQTLTNSRATRWALDLDPLQLVRSLAGDSSSLVAALSRLRPITGSRTRTRLSVFDLAAFTPRLSYQLALGGMDNFLTTQGQAAISAGEMITDEFTVDLDLPASLTVSTRYVVATSERYQSLIGGGRLQTSSRQETWPSGNASWGTMVGLGPLTRLSTRLQFDRQATSSATQLASGDVSRATTTTRQLRPSLDLFFDGGVSMSIQNTVDRGVTTGLGSLTRRNVDQFNVTVMTTTRLPRVVSRLRRALTISLDALQRSERSCLERDQADGCVPYSDFERISVRGSVFAVLGSSAQRAGMDFSWSLDNNRSLRQKMSGINLRTYFVFPLSFLEN